MSILLNRRVALTAIALAIAPALASARIKYESWGNLKKLRLGQKIEVLDMNFKSLRGTFLSSSEDAISLQVGNKEVTVQRPNVARVNSREKTKRGRNSLIGAAIGAGAGGALSVFCAVLANEGGNGPACVAAYVGVGSGIGAGLGALIPGYTPIYRVKKVRVQSP